MKDITVLVPLTVMQLRMLKLAVLKVHQSLIEEESIKKWRAIDSYLSPYLIKAFAHDLLEEEDSRDE